LIWSDAHLKVIEKEIEWKYESKYLKLKEEHAMANPNHLTAGVIGLGLIGGGVAASLVHSGRIPLVYDIIPDAYQKHEGVPAQLSSAAAVARASNVVMIATFDAAQAKDVLTGNDGLLEGAHEGLVVVLLSTVTVEEAREIAEICSQKGVRCLDCGVTPGSLAAKNGLIAMVGGDQDALAYARPVIADWSADIIYCGSSGAGMAAKIARNVNTFGMWRIVHESTQLALASGISPDKYLELLTKLDVKENLFYNFLRHAAKTSDGRLPDEMKAVYPKFMQKDLGVSITLSDALGVKMPVRDLVFDLINDTCGLNDSDK